MNISGNTIFIPAGEPDRRAESIVSRLLQISPEFAEVWGRDEVAARFEDHKTLVHPELGEIEVDCQALFTENQAQTLLVTRRRRGFAMPHRQGAEFSAWRWPRTPRTTRPCEQSGQASSIRMRPRTN